MVSFGWGGRVKGGSLPSLTFAHVFCDHGGCAKTSFVCCFSLPSYLGQFDTNYIIFRNVEIFKNYFFQIKKYCEENSGYFKIFSFVEMNFFPIN